MNRRSAWMRGVGVKLVGYFLTGGTAAVVDVGGFALFCAIRMPIIAAAVTSFCLATVVNFLFSSRCVFSRTPTTRGFGLFFVAALGGMLINVSLTSVASFYLGVAPVFAKILGVGTAFLLNFWVNLRIVFRTASAPRNP